MTLEQQTEHWEMLAHGLLFEPKKILPNSLQPGGKTAAAWMLVYESPGISPRSLFERLNDMGRNVTYNYALRIIEELTKRGLFVAKGPNCSRKLFARRTA